MADSILLPEFFHPDSIGNRIAELSTELAFRKAREGRTADLFATVSPGTPAQHAADRFFHALERVTTCPQCLHQSAVDGPEVHAGFCIEVTGMPEKKPNTSVRPSMAAKKAVR